MGLQILDPRFKSGWRLQKETPASWLVFLFADTDGDDRKSERKSLSPLGHSPCTSCVIAKRLDFTGVRADVFCWRRRWRRSKTERGSPVVAADCISFAAIFYALLPKITAHSSRRAASPNRPRFVGFRFADPACVPVFTAPSSTIHAQSPGRTSMAKPRSRMTTNTATVRKPKSICSSAFYRPVMCAARLFVVTITAYSNAPVSALSGPARRIGGTCRKHGI